MAPYSHCLTFNKSRARSIHGRSHPNRGPADCSLTSRTIHQFMEHVCVVPPMMQKIFGFPCIDLVRSTPILQQTSVLFAESPEYEFAGWPPKSLRHNGVKTKVFSLYTSRPEGICNSEGADIHPQQSSHFYAHKYQCNLSSSLPLNTFFQNLSDELEHLRLLRRLTTKCLKKHMSRMVSREEGDVLGPSRSLNLSTIFYIFLPYIS